MTMFARERDVIKIIMLGILVLLFSLTPVTLKAEPREVQLLSIGNIGAVQNNPSRSSKFVLDSPFVITYLYTYHWNDGNGTNPGTITLRRHDGRIYGPYQVTGSQGQGGVPNAVWEVYLNVEVPPGKYTVVDSEPYTWSCNAESENRGFAVVKGYRSHHRRH